jgi:hypothetical protein
MLIRVGIWCQLSDVEKKFLLRKISNKKAAS